MTQMRGTFLQLWDELLPLPDSAAFRADFDLVAPGSSNSLAARRCPSARWPNS